MLTDKEWAEWYKLIELADAVAVPTMARIKATKLLRQEIEHGNQYVPPRLRPDAKPRQRKGATE